MMDSCSPRRLEDGLAHAYSIPRDLSTSTQKSEPGRSIVRTSALPDVVPLSASGFAATGGAPRFCWAVRGPWAASAAPAAAPFKKPRRSTEDFFDSDIAVSFLRKRGGL